MSAPFRARNKITTALLFFLASLLGTACADNAVSLGAAPPVPDCLAGLQRQQATIRSITDGDTIVLNDNRRVRLIGFNTPELQRRGKNGETAVQAELAREALLRFVEDSGPVTLYIGRDAHDRHGRTLAHLQHSDGRLAAEYMLSEGHAAYSAVAPNTLCSKRFAALEAGPRARGQGVWQQPELWRIDAANLTRRHGGFHIVRGTLLDVLASNRYTTLVLDNKLRVRIRKSLARSLPIDTWRGRDVEVRGWLSLRDGQHQLRLHDAVNLVVLK